MNPDIREKFANAAEQGRAAFVPYVTGGYPNADTCLELISALDELGSEVIEVGLPFSDPLADGPTIQLSSQRALEAGATPVNVLQTMERAAAKTSAALVAMTYVNPVLSMGYEEFAKRAVGSGVSGVIIPDLPPEEAGEWLEACAVHGLDPVFMAAPGTSTERLDKILAKAGGFLYYVSMDGVTGTELELPPSGWRPWPRCGPVPPCRWRWALGWPPRPRPRPWPRWPTGWWWAAPWCARCTRRPRPRRPSRRCAPWPVSFAPPWRAENGLGGRLR